VIEMKKRVRVVMAIVLSLAIVVTGIGVALSTDTVSADKPPGKLAYNLNIIGRGNYGGGEVNAGVYPGGGADNQNRHTIPFLFRLRPRGIPTLAPPQVDKTTLGLLSTQSRCLRKVLS
jgi:hypothetical protein